MTAERAADAAFAGLLALTAASFATAEAVGHGTLVPVLALAGLKAWIIGERCMDLARAHVLLRVGVAALVVAVVGAIGLTARLA